MPRVGFEPTIPVFEREKTVHASYCACVRCTRHQTHPRHRLVLAPVSRAEAVLLQPSDSDIPYGIFHDDVTEYTGSNGGMVDE
jgi:hypothetical protein